MHQHPKAEVVALVGSGGEQQEVAAVRADGLGQFVVFCFAGTVAAAIYAQVVRLIKDNEVPRWRAQEASDACRALKCVNRGYDPIVFGKGVGFAVCDVPFGAENFEIEVENVVQLVPSVFNQSGGHDHQGALQLAPADELAEDERGFDGLCPASEHRWRQGAGYCWHYGWASGQRALYG